MPLPTELYEQILQDVDNRDLKNCRLASRQLEQSATPRLFRQVTIALSNFSKDALQQIASSERLRHHVREIVWDARKLPERWQTHMSNETMPLTRFIQPLSRGHKQIFGEVYKRLCVEQYWLEKYEEPKIILVNTIPRFTHLTTLILSSRRSDLETPGVWESQSLPDALSSGILRSYTTWAMQACLCNAPGPVTPQDNLPFFALTQALRGPRQEYTPPRYIPRSPYTTVKTLILHLDIDRASAIFSSRDSCRHQAELHAFRFLHVLSLTVTLPHADGLDMPAHADAWAARNSRMTWDLSGLLPAPCLQKLELRLPDHKYDFPTLPGHTAYPLLTLYNPSIFSSLRSLALSFCNTTAIDLTRFFYAHRRTLRIVHMERIYLRQGRWTRVFEDARKMNVLWEDVRLIGLLDACVGERVDCSEAVLRFLKGGTDDAPFKGLAVRKGRARDISEEDYDEEDGEEG